MKEKENRNKNRKRIMILIAMMLVLSMALIGCGNKSDDEDQSGSSQQQEQQDQSGSEDQSAEEEGQAADDSPYGLYKQVCKKVQALDSVTYTAELENEIEYSGGDEQRSTSKINSTEVYRNKTMDMSFESSFSTFGTKGSLNIYYKDGRLYYDNDGKKSQQKAGLKKLLNKTMRYSDPYMYLKGNSLFKIEEGDIKSIKAENDDDGIEIEIVLKDACIDHYFVLDLDEESSLYGSGFTPSNYEIEISLDKQGSLTDINMSYDTEFSAGEGEVSWECDIKGMNDTEKIDFPEFVEN